MTRIIIIMGVSGCGKTTVGKKLASVLELPFYDADDFHPEENITKMSNDIPLNDDDRKPWLETLAKQLQHWSKNDGAVLACSALKESYRKLLATQVQKIEWVFLSGNYQEIRQRLQLREEHFMKATLLQSQFDTLEIPSYGIHIDCTLHPEKICTEIIKKLHKHA